MRMGSVCVLEGGGATLCSTTPVFHFNGPKGPRIPLNCFPPCYVAKFTLLGHHRQARPLGPLAF